MRNMFILAALAVGCAGMDAGYEDVQEDFEIGQTSQGVGFKTGSVYSYGSINVSGQPHRHSRCGATGSSTCTVPRTKGPTYYIASSMNATEAQVARAAVAAIDNQVNWTFTETTDAANATLTFNRLDTCAGEDIQDYVCVNLTGQGNTLTESPNSIPNSYTEHTKGVIHVNRAKVNACQSCGYGPCGACPTTEKNKRMMHGFQAAIVSWMGLGLSGYSNVSSPANRFVRDPDDTAGLTAGEKCKLNGFLPAGQFGTPTTVGVISNCNAD